MTVGRQDGDVLHFHRFLWMFGRALDHPQFSAQVTTLVRTGIRLLGATGERDVRLGQKKVSVRASVHRIRTICLG